MPTIRCPQCELPLVEEEIIDQTCPECAYLFQEVPEAIVIDTSPEVSERVGFWSRSVTIYGISLGCLLTVIFAWLIGFFDEDPATKQLRAELASKQSAYDRLQNQSKNLSQSWQQLDQERDQLTQEKNQLVAGAKQTQLQLAKLQETLQQANKDLLAVKRQAQTRTFAGKWLAAGPFFCEGSIDRDHRFGPEVDLFDEKQVFTLGEQKITWKPLVSLHSTISLDEFYQCTERAISYSICWVYSEEDQTIKFSLGSDDGIKVWLNRKLIHDNKVNRALSAGQDRVDVEVKSGWNEVLLKIDNGSSNWGQSLEFRRADDSAFLPMYSTNEPPPQPKQ